MNESSHTNSTFSVIFYFMYFLFSLPFNSCLMEPDIYTCCPSNNIDFRKHKNSGLRSVSKRISDYMRSNWFVIRSCQIKTCTL